MILRQELQVLHREAEPFGLKVQHAALGKVTLCILLPYATGKSGRTTARSACRIHTGRAGVWPQNKTHCQLLNTSVLY